MISVIVPVHNSEEYLKTCLETLVNQTLKDIEIIIVDDASTDHSRDIIEYYKSKYKNIKTYYSAVNIGAGASRNIGLSLAQGDYVGFLDSDDYVNLNMFETMYESAKQNDFPDMVITGLRFVKDDSYALKDLSFAASKTVRNISDKASVMTDLSPSVCNKIFRREIISDYRFLEDCKWEDIAFTFGMYMASSRVIMLNNPDYFYRRDITKGISGINYQKNSRVTEIFRVTDEIMNRAVSLGKDQEYKNELQIICFSAIFERVSEINKWEIDQKEKTEIKNMIYQITFNKYGRLDSMDMALLSARAPMDVVDEYTEFCNNMKKI